MAHLGKETRENRGGFQRITVPEGISQPKSDSRHVLGGQGNARDQDTLRLVDPDPALLGLPAWSSTFDSRSGSIPAFLEEQERFWQTGGTHRATYHARHNLPPGGVAEALAEEDRLWRLAKRRAGQKKMNDTAAEPPLPSAPKAEPRRRATVDTQWRTASFASSSAGDHEARKRSPAKGRPFQTRTFHVDHDPGAGAGNDDTARSAADQADTILPTSPSTYAPLRSITLSNRSSRAYETVADSSSDSDGSPDFQANSGPKVSTAPDNDHAQKPGAVDSTPRPRATSIPGDLADYYMAQATARPAISSALPTVPSLPSDEDSLISIPDSLGSLLQESNAIPFFETDRWFARLEDRTQPLLRELRRANMKSRVKIAILDTGIDLRHDAFKGQFPNGRIKKVEDFVEPNGNGADINGHGTHCVALLRKVAPEADIYVARVAVGRGLRSGLTPDNVVKALNRACGSGTNQDGTENWDVDIVSMSLGFYRNDPKLSRAVQLACADGKIIVAAVSNDGDTGASMWPASERVVFAIHPARGWGLTSATAPVPMVGNDFSILGENVESAWLCGTDADGNVVNTSTTERRSGASVATPIAAGVMALVLELAMQGDPGTGSDAIFAAMLPRLKSFDGMREILAAMSTRRDPLNLNIVPWVLLDAKLDSNPDPDKRASRTHLAIVMKFILRRRFG